MKATSAVQVGQVMTARRQAVLPVHDTRPCRDLDAGLVRVALCEEHHLVRHGTRLLLDATADIGVCRDVASPSELDDLPGSPDVVVHGLVYPEMEGPPVVRALRARFPRAALLVLSRLANPLYAHLCMMAGAQGYLLKTAEPDQLLAAVRHVARGEEYVQPALGAALARWRDFPRRQRPESLVLLTAREQQVLELLAGGHTNAETAAMLGIALRTVEAHRAHIFDKLALKSRAELVRFASEHRLA